MKSNNSRIINQQRESKFNKIKKTSDEERKKIFDAGINKNKISKICQVLL